MRTARLGRSIAPFTVMVLIALAGCSSDQPGATKLNLDDNQQSQSQHSPTPSPSATPTETPTGPQEAPSIHPSVSSEKQQQAAEDFLRRYIEEVNRATRTGDISTLKTMAADSCELCQFALETEEVYAKGYTITGGEWTPTSIDYKRTVNRSLMYRVELKIAESDDVDKNGDSVKHYPGGEAAHFYVVAKRNGNWIIVGGSDLS